jgi:hypothetical protein
MEITLRLFLLLFVAVVSRFIFVLSAAVIFCSLFCGLVAALSGGSFWYATLYAFIACVSPGILAAVVAGGLAIYART